MTDKFESIKNEDIKLSETGEFELSEELQDAVAGGINPEEGEEEGVALEQVKNLSCGNNCAI